MIVFTSICANYTHKARILAESVKKWIPDAMFIVCLVEQQVEGHVACPAFDRVVLARDAWEGNFNRFIFKHTIVEASTSVKGQFFRYLFKEYPEETKFIYLDPDVRVYSDFTELRELLETKPIVLCPHLLQPGNIDMELSSTAHGVYNLGFLAVDRSPEAMRFIDWWAERLYMFCFDDIQRGIFTDQKWIDIAPCFFDTHILKHRGYDFAPWSLLDCGMTREENGIHIKGDPLRFIHFSGFGSSAEKCMREWLPAGDHPFRDLYEEYAALHEASDADGVSATPWSYGTYSDGKRIDKHTRIGYRNDYDVMFSMEDPFSRSNRFMLSRFGRSFSNIGRRTPGRISRIRALYRRGGMAAVFKKILSRFTGRFGG